ncbi:MAG: SpoIIE family protein phosphatase [Planctomycetaceae bacterium]|jgi:serine phosphatase RsbU (regulator of sigma subunit)/pSer/pThr/pTyr-binding forkhead associated (FHA) protein
MDNQNFAQLIVLKSGETVNCEIRQDETLLGRAKNCDIPIESNMVSTRHARILGRGTRYFIEDLSSTNGTFVNGKRITELTELKDDDRIKLGPVLIRFSLPGRSKEGSPAAAQAPLPPNIGVSISDDARSSSVVTATLDSTSSRFGILQANPQEKLKAIIEISQALAGTIELEAILPRILESLFRIFPSVDRGVILLKDSSNGQMIPRAIRHRDPGEDQSVVLSRTIVNQVLEKRQGILSADDVGSYNPGESVANFKSRSMMCMPLLALSGDPIGLIHIDTNRLTGQFNQDDLDLLAAIAGQAALNYETARLFEVYVEKQKYDTEMRTAAQVQRALLPGSLPQVPGYSFFAAYESAQAVGGDYYDCRVMGDSRVWMAFGDVAGKGVAASLIMSRLSSVVQSTLEFIPDVGEALRRINTQMGANMIEGRFVTLILASLDLNTHELTIVSGGHMSPLIRRPNGTIEELSESVVGLPVGIFDELEFETVRRVLSPGESVVIYTDGISEANNSKEELYGLDRLRTVVTRSPPSPELLGNAIMDDVHRHAAGSPQHDDITLMVFGRGPLS